MDVHTLVFNQASNDRNSNAEKEWVEEELANPPWADEGFFEEFAAAFRKMSPEEKWTLSTGKVVEDELYKFGKKCNHEHPCHSWILDTKDKNYTKEGHFTEEELEEIHSLTPVTFPDIPVDIDNYMQSLDATTTADLRIQCAKCPLSEPFNRDKDFDAEWVLSSVRMMIHEYESGNLRTSHNELWYMLRIWSMVDRLFDNMPGLETVRGDSASISTSLRKNEERTSSSVIRMKRKIMGRRGDLLLQKGTAEYGCAEAGAKFDGPNGSKRMVESGLKTPKMLKDMLNNLAIICQQEEARVVGLRTVGFILSGLTMEILTMDAPNGYITRLTRSKLYQVPKEVSSVNAILLPLLSVLISTK
ncbi:hypothetical protein INT44_007787, partial [Umbelopsis vinacea]